MNGYNAPALDGSMRTVLKMLHMTKERICPLCLSILNVYSLPRAHAQRGKVIGSVVVVVVVVVHTKIARSRILGEFASPS